MAIGFGLYKSHRDEFRKITELNSHVDIKCDNPKRVRNSANRFMKEESKYILSCKTLSNGIQRVFAIDLIENWKAKK